jgi:hypothetical protein
MRKNKTKGGNMPTKKKKRDVEKPFVPEYAFVSSRLPTAMYNTVMAYIDQYNANNAAKMSMNSLIPAALIAYVENKKGAVNANHN